MTRSKVAVASCARRAGGTGRFARRLIAMGAVVVALAGAAVGQLVMPTQVIANFEEAGLSFDPKITHTWGFQYLMEGGVKWKQNGQWDITASDGADLDAAEIVSDTACFDGKCMKTTFSGLRAADTTKYPRVQIKADYYLQPNNGVTLNDVTAFSFRMKANKELQVRFIAMRDMDDNKSSPNYTNYQTYGKYETVTTAWKEFTVVFPGDLSLENWMALQAPFNKADLRGLIWEIAGSQNDTISSGVIYIDDVVAEYDDGVCYECVGTASVSNQWKLLSKPDKVDGTEMNSNRTALNDMYFPWFAYVDDRGTNITGENLSGDNKPISVTFKMGEVDAVHGNLPYVGVGTLVGQDIGGRPNARLIGLNANSLGIDGFYFEYKTTNVSYLQVMVQDGTTFNNQGGEIHSLKIPGTQGVKMGATVKFSDLKLPWWVGYSTSIDMSSIVVLEVQALGETGTTGSLEISNMYFTGGNNDISHITLPKNIVYADMSDLHSTIEMDKPLPGDWVTYDDPTDLSIFETLKKDVDYYVTYTSTDAPGPVTATIVGKGNYIGEKDFHFTLLPGSNPNLPPLCNECIADAQPAGSVLYSDFTKRANWDNGPFLSEMGTNWLANIYGDPVPIDASVAKQISVEVSLVPNNPANVVGIHTEFYGYNATGSNVNGIYVEYKTVGNMDFMQVTVTDTVITNDMYNRNAWHVALPPTNGAWKMASIPFSKFWEGGAIPMGIPLNTAALASMQFEIHANSYVTTEPVVGSYAIRNVRFTGTSIRTPLPRDIAHVGVTMPGLMEYNYIYGQGDMLKTPVPTAANYWDPVVGGGTPLDSSDYTLSYRNNNVASDSAQVILTPKYSKLPQTYIGRPNAPYTGKFEILPAGTLMPSVGAPNIPSTATKFSDFAKVFTSGEGDKYFVTEMLTTWGTYSDDKDARIKGANGITVVPVADSSATLKFSATNGVEPYPYVGMASSFEGYNALANNMTGIYVEYSTTLPHMAVELTDADMVAAGYNNSFQYVLPGTNGVLKGATVPFDFFKQTWSDDANPSKQALDQTKLGKINFSYDGPGAGQFTVKNVYLTGTTTRTLPRTIDLALAAFKDANDFSYVADGSPKTPTVVMYYGGLAYDYVAKNPIGPALGLPTLTAGADYDLSYENNVAAGRAKVVLTGKGNYIGTTTGYNYTMEFDILTPAQGDLLVTAKAFLADTAYWTETMGVAADSDQAKAAVGNLLAKRTLPAGITAESVAFGAYTVAVGGTEGNPDGVPGAQDFSVVLKAGHNVYYTWNGSLVITPLPVFKANVETAAHGTASAGAEYYAAGAQVNIVLRDIPANQRFTGWTVTPAVPFVNSTSRDTVASFIMPSGAVTVAANFVQLYRVTVESGVIGSANGALSAYYAAGEQVRVVADPNPSAAHRFKEWTGLDEVTDSVARKSLSVTFLMPGDSVSATATYELWPRLVTFSVVGGNGSVTAKVGTDSIAFGSYVSQTDTVVFTAVPADSNYQVKEWKVGGVVVAGNKTNTLTQVVGAGIVNVTVEFETIKHPVTVSVVGDVGGGTVSGTGMVNGASRTVNTTVAVSFDQGTSVTFTARPVLSYRVKEWKVDGTVVGAKDNTYVLDAVTSDAAVSVEFERIPAITFSGQSANGSVTALKSSATFTSGSVAEIGEEIVFTAAPNIHYQVKAWRVDGVEVDTTNIYTYTATGAPANIAVEFKLVPVYITFANPAEGGSLSAVFSGSSFATGGSVGSGQRVTFTATPDASYQVKSWIVNGDSVATGNTYTFTASQNVPNATVAVTFVRIPRAVSFSVTGANGTGTVTAKVGDSVITSGSNVSQTATVVFTAVPADSNYQVKEWKVGGVVVGGNKTNTLTHVVGAGIVNVSVEFELKPYAVTFAVGTLGNGSVTAKVDSAVFMSGRDVGSGKSIVLTAIPSSQHYEVDRWEITGTAEAAQIGGTTFTHVVTKPVDIKVTFKRILFTVSYGSSITARTDSGSVASGGTVGSGMIVTFTAEPTDADHEVTTWAVNGTAVTAGISGDRKTVLTYNVLGPITSVTATYGRIPRTVIFTSPANGSLSAVVGTAAYTSGRSVGQGDTITFTAKPNQYYSIARWVVDSVTVAGATDSIYKHRVSARASSRVSVEFAITGYQIAYSVVGSTGGTITTSSPSANPASVTAMSDITFTAAPAANYRVKAWRVDGALVPGNTSNSYKLSSVTKNAAVTVEFERRQVAVTFGVAGDSTWGTVAAANFNSGDSIAAVDGSVTFNATPILGGTYYRVKEWKVGGAVVAGKTNTYTLSNRTANTNVTVEFEINAQAVVDAVAGKITWKDVVHGRNDSLSTNDVRRKLNLPQGMTSELLPSDLRMADVAGAVEITWESDDDDVINSATGRVTRPAEPDGDATVKLTATVAMAGAEKTTSFNDLIVPAIQDPVEEVLTVAVDFLDGALENQDEDILGNIFEAEELGPNSSFTFGIADTAISDGEAVTVIGSVASPDENATSAEFTLPGAATINALLGENDSEFTSGTTPAVTWESPSPSITITMNSNGTFNVSVDNLPTFEQGAQVVTLLLKILMEGVNNSPAPQPAPPPNALFRQVSAAFAPYNAVVLNSPAPAPSLDENDPGVYYNIVEFKIIVQPKAPVAVTKVEVTGSDITTLVGTSVLTAELNNGDDANYKDVKWEIVSGGTYAALAPVNIEDPLEMTLIALNNGNGKVKVSATVTDFSDNVKVGEKEIDVSGQMTAPALTATSGQDGQVPLTWTDASPGSSGTIDGYELNYVGNIWEPVSGTSHTVTGLTNGTSYTFNLRAVNGSHKGPVGSKAAMPSAAPLIVPSAPTSVDAVAGYKKVTLSWGAPSSNGGSSVTAYQYRYRLTSATDWANEIVGDWHNLLAATTGVTVDDLTNDLNYTFQIRAVNANGNGVIFTITATPKEPTSVVIIGGGGGTGPIVGTAAIEPHHFTYDLSPKAYTGYQQPVAVTSMFSDLMGSISVLYNGSANPPVTVGSYNVSVAVSGGTVFAAGSLPLGSYRILAASTVAEGEKLIPGGGASEGAVVVPVSGLSAGFAAGPNPVLGYAGSVAFFWQGKACESGALSIYDAQGNLVRKVSVSDRGVGVRREIGSWDLKDAKGRAVPEGTYLVRGVIVGKDGSRERVSYKLGIVW